MDTRNVLVVFYSRSGRTRAIARAVGDSLACEVEELVDETNRRGLRGYLRSGFDALFRRPAKLRPMAADPARFDLVIVGTPVWNASVSAPIRTFLEKYSGRLRHVAFFLSHGGRGSRRTFRQMERLAGGRPVATLAVREAIIDHGRLENEAQAFVDEVRAQLRGEVTGRPRAEGLRSVAAS